MDETSPLGQAMAKKIWDSRHTLVVGWIVLAVLMAPFAYELATGPNMAKCVPSTLAADDQY